VKLGIEAPSTIPVHRQEVYEEIQRNKSRSMTGFQDHNGRSTGTGPYIQHSSRAGTQKAFRRQGSSPIDVENKARYQKSRA